MSVENRDALRKRQVRLAAAVIIIAYLAWMGLNYLGRVMAWPQKYSLLIDLAAIAAFVWAMIVLLRVWRATRPSAGS